VKPEVLVMQAFGPYAGRHVLDFGDLRGNGFFLIHGPTGAGKTTILDAMAFALYGDTSGAEREARAMRSDHADPSVPTEVRFDFAVGQARYRVVRAPLQERPKQRGEGTTTVQPRAELWELPGGQCADGERLIASRWGEVTKRIEEILGFRSVQFRQVVMLPQGKFQELLQAKGSDREEILQRLFRTDRYRELQEALKRTAQAAEGELRDALAERERTLARFAANSPADLSQRIAAHTAAVEALDERIATAAGEEQRTHAELVVAAAVNEKLAELAAAEQEDAALRARADEVDRQREELERAQRAAHVAESEALVREREQALAQREESLRQCEAALAQARQEYQAAWQAHEREVTREPERQALEGRLRELDGMAEKIAVLRSLEEAASAAAAALAASSKERTAVRAAYDQAQADEAQARAAWQAAETELAALDEAFLAGQAAVLAARLRPGEPCPVCGARDHPQPAVAQGEVPSESDLASRRAAVERLRDAYDQARDEVAECQATLAEVERAVAEAAARAEEAAARRDEVVRQVPEALRGDGALEAERSAIEAALDVARAAAERSAEAERRASDVLVAAEATAERERSGCQEAQHLLDEARAEVQRKLEQEAFVDLDDYRAARRSVEAVGELQRAVAQYDAAAQGLVAPDVTALEQAHAAAQSLTEALRDERASLVAERAAVAQAVDDLAKLQEVIGAREEQYAVIGRLSAVANGQSPENPLKLSFQRYMLGAYLDDVLVVASQRLQRMTDGRYTLQRVSGGDKRGALGLDLEVADAYTGKARHVSTLSGGETFQASLALALGLADVVQAYEGGVKLETVFVDEGFGSLDPDNLAAALDTLMGLQTGGRLVGIISHVADLRDQIDARLEVTRTRSGSTARFIVP